MPRLHARAAVRSPGPPKRFAQAMGATMTVAAAVLALGSATAPRRPPVLLALVVVAATLESVFAYLHRLQGLRAC